MKSVSLPYHLTSSWTGDVYTEIEVCINSDLSVDYVWIEGGIHTDTATIALIKKLIGERKFARDAVRALSESVEFQDDSTEFKKAVELELERKVGI